MRGEHGTQSFQRPIWDPKGTLLKWTNKNTKDLKGPIGAKQFLRNNKCPKWTQNGLKLQKN